MSDKNNLGRGLTTTNVIIDDPTTGFIESHEIKMNNSSNKDTVMSTPEENAEYVQPGWNPNMKEAPHNQEVLVQDKNMRDTFATFDPKWGKNGAWFNRKNQIVADPWCWRGDIEAYLKYRATIKNAVPIR